MLAAIVVLRYAGDVFVPVVLAVFVSYALEPVVARMVRWHVPRSVAAALVLATIFGALGAGVYRLSDDVLRLAEDIPPAFERLRDAVRSSAGSGGGPLEKVQKAATEIERSAAEAAGQEQAPRGVTRVQVEEKPLNVRGYLWTGSMGVVGMLLAVPMLVVVKAVCERVEDLKPVAELLGD